MSKGNKRMVLFAVKEEKGAVGIVKERRQRRMKDWERKERMREEKGTVDSKYEEEKKDDRMRKEKEKEDSSCGEGREGSSK